MAVCDPWTTEAELVECGCPDGLLDSSYTTDLITAASDLLDRWTGERFGVCTTTEYPCKPCECSSVYCQCRGWEIVELRFGPISGTPTVTIDGAGFTAFEVVAPNMLRRTDQDSWPRCNSLESGYEFKVTYDHGLAVPALGRLAASDLAIELLKSCNDDATCSIPAGTVRLTQRGATVEIDADTAGSNLPRVAMFLSAYPKASRVGVTRMDRPRGLITSGPA